MPDSSYFPLLKKKPILNTAILQHAAIKKYKAKEIVLSSIQKVSYLFYLVKGTVRLNVDEMNGNSRTLFWAEAGNFVYEAHFFNTPVITASLESVSDSELAVFRKEKVFYLLEKEFDFRMTLIEGLTQKLLVYGGEMSENSYANDAMRLLKLLQELAENNIVLVTQTELAMMCGVHRVTINRWCQALKSQNLIKTERNKIRLL